MNDFDFLQQSFENFNKATASLREAYAHLEQKFENINRELAAKNLELERSIAEKKKLEDMAKRTDKFAAMGEMAANIAHEIRNPLGSIELFASLLLKDLKKKRDRDRVSKIMTSVKNMDNKISNLLLFTKSYLPCPACVNAGDVLEETLLFAAQLAAEGNIALSFNPAVDEEVFVLGDAEMLKQVFLNLILNAFQAMPDGGRLNIETRASSSGQNGAGTLPFLEINFADTGAGIPEEDLPRIFDPFFSTREGTSGLGLAIVHNILDMHKGAIHVESGRGSGTVFTVLLPLMSSNL